MTIAFALLPINAKFVFIGSDVVRIKVSDFTLKNEADNAELSIIDGCFNTLDLVTIINQ